VASATRGIASKFRCNCENGARDRRGASGRPHPFAPRVAHGAHLRGIGEQGGDRGGRAPRLGRDEQQSFTEQAALPHAVPLVAARGLVFEGDDRQAEGSGLLVRRTGLP